MKKNRLQPFLRAAILLLTLLATSVPTFAYSFVSNGIYYNINGNSVSVTYKDTNYNSYSGTVTIPSSVTYNGNTYSVTAIANYAFYNCTGLTKITIPNSVTTIGYSAFENCTGLTNITIPVSVNSIGSYAFSNCSSLSKLTWNAKNCSSNGNMTTSNITQVTIGSAVESIPYSFVTGSKITTVTIPNSVKTIGYSAFQNCTGLTNITIPNSVISIGNGAFQNCTALTSATIGTGVTSIDYCAFQGCTALKTLNYNAISCAAFANSNNNSSNTPFYNLNITTINFGSNVQTIPAFFAYGLTKLTSITIPASVNNIGWNAFYNCAPTKLTWNAKNCTSNGDMTTSNITQVTIGTQVEVLPYNFVGGSKITSITIPNSVQSIGSSAFYGCTALKTVDIPNSVTSIGSGAFQGCTNLNSVKLPNSVFNIESCAFSNCPKLLSVTCKAIMPPVIDYSYMFDAVTYQNAVLYVPDLTYGYYIQTNPWNLFSEIKTVPYSGDGIEFDATIYPTSVRIEGASQTGTSYFTFNGKKYNTTLMVTGLEPNHIYSATYTKGGVETPLKFYTSSLMMVPEGATMLNETTALLKAETNMADEETICGFDWRRYEGPDDYLGTRVYCPVYDGTMAGTLKNLSRDTFYKFRPFYKSSDGNVYYGDWVTFYTADAGVEFDPVVYTYNSPAVTQNGATLEGVALRGSDAITQQGFEYWKANTSSKTKVTASGERMSKTVSGLQSGTKYKFRAYVTAGGKTTYGSEVEFTTLSNVVSGDVNSDGVVNISDVTAVISYVLTGSSSGINLSNADVNGDGSVNISDVTALISRVLNGN